jgi:class 3 adenylate cyclase
MLNRHTIHKKHSVSCVALVVDINGSEKLIAAGADGLTGQFFRDLLAGGIKAVEQCNGSVISFTGDGFQAVLPTEKDAAHACWHIAKDLRKIREYLSDTCDDGSPAWPQMEVGVGLKIAIERGVLEVSSIHSSFLGELPFLVGEPTVYASRILAFGEGDRCLVGPKAAANWEYGGLDGPYEGKGKHKGLTYAYYFYDLDDLWED